MMGEEIFSSPRRQEGANRDSQPTSNTGIGKWIAQSKNLPAKRLESSPTFATGSGNRLFSPLSEAATLDIAGAFSENGL
jgi:hypothetical protein